MDKNWVVVSKIFYFHPYLGKMNPIGLIFFKGVAQPPTRKPQTFLLKTRVFMGFFLKNDESPGLLAQLRSPPCPQAAHP